MGVQNIRIERAFKKAPWACGQSELFSHHGRKQRVKSSCGRWAMTRAQCRSDKRGPTPTPLSSHSKNSLLLLCPPLPQPHHGTATSRAPYNCPSALSAVADRAPRGRTNGAAAGAVDTPTPPVSTCFQPLGAPGKPLHLPRQHGGWQPHQPHRRSPARPPLWTRAQARGGGGPQRPARMCTSAAASGPRAPGSAHDGCGRAPTSGAVPAYRPSLSGGRRFRDTAAPAATRRTATRRSQAHTRKG